MAGGVVIGWISRTRDAVTDTDRLTRSIQGVDGAAKTAGGTLGKLGGAAKKGLVGVAVAGAVGVGVFVKMAEAAIEDAAAAEKLAASLRKSTKATDKGVEAAEDWITKTMLMSGVADDDLRPALERAARSTKDLGKAQDLVSLAMDISARTGKPLGTVIRALTKANDGNVGSLKGLGLTLGDNAQNAIEYGKEQKKLLTLQGEATAAYERSGGRSKEYRDALAKVADQQKIVNGLAAEGVDWQKELGDEFGGAAAAAGSTLKGTWERIKLIFAEVGEAIGSAALPPLQAFADWFAAPENIGKVQGWIDKVGQWATDIGTTLKGKIADFIKWVKSPEGQEAMGKLADALRDIAAAFVTVGEAFGEAKSFIDWLMGNGPQKLSEMPFEFQGKTIDPYLPRAPGDTSNPAPGRMRRGEAGYNGGGTIINIHNPAPERATTSVASALRVGRPGVWT